MVEGRNLLKLQIAGACIIGHAIDSCVRTSGIAGLRPKHVFAVDAHLSHEEKVVGRKRRSEFDDVVRVAEVDVERTMHVNVEEGDDCSRT